MTGGLESSQKLPIVTLILLKSKEKEKQKEEEEDRVRPRNPTEKKEM